MQPSLQITAFVLHLHFLTKCFQLPSTGDILIPFLHAMDFEKLNTLLRMRSSARLKLLKTALCLMHCLPVFVPSRGAPGVALPLDMCPAPSTSFEDKE